MTHEPFEQAVHALLDPESPLRDPAVLQVWLRKSRCNQQAFFAALAVDGRLDALSRSQWRELGARLGFRRRASAKRGLLAGTAVAVLAGLAVIGAISFDAHRARVASVVAVEQVFATAIGKRKQINLADGTRIELNTDTTVRVILGADVRRVILIRGEALFEIARDPTRPFDVAAGDLVVRAVGTSFGVRFDNVAAPVNVYVTEGAVQVTRQEPERAAERVPLAAGFAAQFARDGSNTPRPERYEPEPVLAWLDGNIRLSRRPLDEAVAEFNRYNTRRIVLDGQRPANLPVSGLFRTDDPESFIAVLATRYAITAHLE